MARPSAAHLAIGTTAQFGVTLLLAIASFLLQIVNAIATPISLTSHSSMDITVASIESGGNSYQSLEQVLGTAGQVAVYASSGRAARSPY